VADKLLPCERGDCAVAIAEGLLSSVEPYARPRDYWCNDDEQVRIIEAALDLYEKAQSASGAIVGTLKVGDGWMVDHIPPFASLQYGTYELRRTDKTVGREGKDGA